MIIFPFFHSVATKKVIANSLKLIKMYLIAYVFERRVQMKLSYLEDCPFNALYSILKTIQS